MSLAFCGGPARRSPTRSRAGRARRQVTDSALLGGGSPYESGYEKRLLRLGAILRRRPFPLRDKRRPGRAKVGTASTRGRNPSVLTLVANDSILGSGAYGFIKEFDEGMRLGLVLGSQVLSW